MAPYWLCLGKHCIKYEYKEGCLCMQSVSVLGWKYFTFYFSHENHGVIESMDDVMVVMSSALIRWPFLCISTNWLLKCFWCRHRSQRSMSGLLVYIIFFLSENRNKSYWRKKKQNSERHPQSLCLWRALWFFLGSSKYKLSNRGISK